jgi:hypothetical protein
MVDGAEAAMAAEPYQITKTLIKLIILRAEG